MTASQPVVLLVEDDAPTREMYRSALRMAGFHLLVAGDGLAALRYLDEVVPAVVVLDLDIPHVNGIALAEELAASRHTADVPIVVVTGTDWPLRRPPAAILTKPISPDDLVAIVSDVLGKRVV